MASYSVQCALTRAHAYRQRWAHSTGKLCVYAILHIDREKAIIHFKQLIRWNKHVLLCIEMRSNTSMDAQFLFAIRWCA